MIPAKFRALSVCCFAAMVPTVALAQQSETASSKVEAAAAKPIERKAEGSKQADWDRLFRAQVYDGLVGTYERTAASNREEPDADTLRFLTTVADWYGQWDPSIDDRKLGADGRALLRRGVDDPALRYISAQLVDDGRSLPGTIGEYEEATRDFARSKHPRCFLARVCENRADYYRSIGDADREKAALDEENEAWIAFLREAHAKGLDPRYQCWEVCRSVADWMPTGAARGLVDCCLTDNEIDPWLARTLEGVWERRRAWEVRTDKWAADVTEAQWRGFRLHLGVARKALTAAYELNPDRPEPAAEMISVAMGEDRPDQAKEQRDWFDRATGAQIDYWRAYQAMLWALRPRWGGSHEAMLAIGKRARATGRYDTNAPFQYVEAVREICDDSGDSPATWANAEIYDTAMEVLGRCSEKADLPGMARRFRSHAAVISWWANRLTDGYSWLEKTGFDLDPSAAIWLKAPPDVVARHIMTYGGPARETFEKANQAVVAKEFDRGLELCNEALSNCKDAPGPVRIAAQGVADSMSMLAGYRKGAWVVPDFSGERGAWRLLRGTWKPTDDKLGFACASDGHWFAAAPYTRFGRRIELEAKLRFPANARSVECAGMLVGFDWSSGPEPMWQSVLLFPRENAVTVGSGTAAKNAVRVAWKLPPNREVLVHLVLWDDTIAVTLDGKQLYLGDLPKLRDSSNSGQGIGFYASDSSSTDAFEFSQIRFRQATSRPEKPPKY